MFTGIVTDVGRVLDIRRAAKGDARLKIATKFALADTPLGASIACAGCCLTVVEKGADWFAVDVSNETLSKTTLGQWRNEDGINLERPLKVGDELGGHLVTGHIDGVGSVVSVSDDGDSRRITFEVPKALARFIAPKGSIAVDGVSLTVNNVTETRFGVNIIPHTQSVTTLGRLKSGDPVNVEIDLLARYVARLHETASP